ncbi:hypothetical protein ACA910_018516 [Epithemia clementina (nom. ined.)]
MGFGLTTSTCAVATITTAAALHSTATTDFASEAQRQQEQQQLQLLERPPGPSSSPFCSTMNIDKLAYLNNLAIRSFENGLFHHAIQIYCDTL